VISPLALVLCITRQHNRNRISSVIVTVLASSTVDRGFELRSGETKDYEIEFSMFYFFFAFRVSERLLFNANPSICQLCHGENTSHFNEMMTRSTL
jgi:hypothetical protein